MCVGAAVCAPTCGSKTLLHPSIQFVCVLRVAAAHCSLVEPFVYRARLYLQQSPKKQHHCLPLLSSFTKNAGREWNLPQVCLSVLFVSSFHTRHVQTTRPPHGCGRPQSSLRLTRHAHGVPVSRVVLIASRRLTCDAAREQTHARLPRRWGHLAGPWTSWTGRPLASRCRRSGCPARRASDRLSTWRPPSCLGRAARRSLCRRTWRASSGCATQASITTTRVDRNGISPIRPNVCTTVVFSRDLLYSDTFSCPRAFTDFRSSCSGYELWPRQRKQRPNRLDGQAHRRHSDWHNLLDPKDSWSGHVRAGMTTRATAQKAKLLPHPTPPFGTGAALR